MAKTKIANPYKFKSMNKWMNGSVVVGCDAITKDNKRHFTTDLDNGIPIFSVMTELSLSPLSHRTPGQVREMEKLFVNSFLGMRGSILPVKDQFYLVLNSEVLHQFKKK